VYWYVGMTSSGSDDSTVGFVLVNSRSKQAKFYQVAGATEEAAAKSAEGQVQEKAYRAGYPLLYNVAGIPTYIAPLKDREGLLKQVAFISVENYNIVGVGPDIATAMRNYLASMAARGNMVGNVEAGKAAEKLAVRGKIARAAIVARGGENYLYFMLENDPVLYAVPASLTAKVLLLRPGDEVGLTVAATGGDAREVLAVEVGY
ncbi:MAG: hypothetical protein N3A57_00540, partial [Negativicutes bacterium]|nr:hypothetical protein [Negativicutes bacterium]